MFSEQPGTLTLYSIYLDGKQGNTPTGENSTFIIKPKDEKGDIITYEALIDNIIDKFSIKIYD